MGAGREEHEEAARRVAAAEEEEGRPTCDMRYVLVFFLLPFDDERGRYYYRLSAGETTKTFVSLPPYRRKEGAAIVQLSPTGVQSLL